MCIRDSCAAFVPTNRLDLHRWKPDFVPLSFYKMFGYPTGAGALLARKSALAKLRRPWYAGGTITIASVQGACIAGGFMVANMCDLIIASDDAFFSDPVCHTLGAAAVACGLLWIDGRSGK